MKFLETAVLHVAAYEDLMDLADGLSVFEPFSIRL